MATNPIETITDSNGNTFHFVVDFSNVKNAPDFEGLSEKVGEIDTALDEIIEIQNSLIGG